MKLLRNFLDMSFRKSQRPAGSEVHEKNSLDRTGQN